MDADLVRGLVVAALLAVALAVAAASVVGAVLLGPTSDRLHFVTPLTTVVPVLLLAAVLVEHGVSSWSLRAALVTTVLIVSAPVTTSALAGAVLRAEGSSAGTAPR